MGKEFQKSTLPTLFHFVRVRAAFQLHVKHDRCKTPVLSSDFKTWTRNIRSLQIGWYPVSKEVGNVRNKDPKLCAPVELEVRTGKALNKSDQKSKQFMANWLENKKRKSNLEEEPSNDDAKKDYSTSTTNKGTNSKVSQHEK